MKRILLDDILYYGFYSWYYWLKDRPKKIYWFFQRGYRGWADCDTWDFDYYLAKIITEGLKHLKKYFHGVDPKPEIIDKIIEAFELAIFLVDNPGQLEHQEEMEARRIIDGGFDLFKKYFNYFWD